MAHRILGVDLGAYCVKVVVANPGFRGASVIDYIEQRVPPGDEPAIERAAGVLGDIIRTRQLADETVCLAAPGDQLFIHVIEFSFRNLKRAELEKVVGAELEDILPIDLEEMVYTFDTIPEKLEADEVPVDLGAPITDEEPTFVQAGEAGKVVRGRVAAPAEGMRVLTCAMPRERARSLLDHAEEQCGEARSLIPAPVSYVRIAERIAGIVSGGPPVAVIDIGHARTDVCVVKDGRAVFARTLPRGGREVTAAIARTWRMSDEEAENAKHTDGFIASGAEPAPSEAWARVHEVIEPELAPLARELKQTLTACRAKTGAVVAQAVLVGGGSRLRGLGSFLSERLRISCAPLQPADHVAIMGERLASLGVGADTAALAAGVALEGSSGRPHFDLRQGDLAFKADLSFLRTKLPTLAAAALIVIAFAAFNAYARLHMLRKHEGVLDQRLALETTKLFGKSLDAKEALAKTGEAGPEANDSPVPKMSAYDLLLDVSNRLPPGKEMKIDITDVDIRPGRVTLKAITGNTDKMDAVQASTELVKALKQQTCFEEVSRGNISAGPNDTKNFPVNIKSNCR